MKTRTLFSSALLLAGLAVLVLNSRSSSQEPTILIDGFQADRTVIRTIVDGELVPSDEPVILPFEPVIENPIIGTLIFGTDDELRAVIPAFQFDSGRPQVIEYMQLQGQLAERLSDEQLESEIAELRVTLEVMDADNGLGEIRASLRNLIESHPDTPAADAARRALEQLDAADQADDNNPFHDPGSAGLKPADGNRSFRNSSSSGFGSTLDDN